MSELNKPFEQPVGLNYLRRTRISKKLLEIEPDYTKEFCIIGVGKLGSAIAQILLDRGFKVIGLDILDESKINPSIASRKYYDHYKVDFTNYSQLEKIFSKHCLYYTFHTFIQNPLDVEVFHDSLSGDCFRFGMMSTIHTYKNPKTAIDYEINHRKNKINPVSLENGKYASLKRQSEILFKQKFGRHNKIFLPKCNHIIGANPLDSRSATCTEVFNGYPLGISPPDFRTLTKQDLEKSEIFLPNNGDYEYNIVDLLTLSEVIAGVMMSGNYQMELNIGNPIRLTAKDYYILVAKEFGLIKSESDINEFKQKFRNIDEQIVLEPESMTRNWRLDLRKMLQITRKLGYDNTKEFWDNRHIDGIRKSALIQPQEGEFIRQRMNLK
jgi:hypothetical protein